MAAEQDFFAAQRGSDSGDAGSGAYPALIEMRLHFDGYENHTGRIEGRDASGHALFSAEIAQVIGSIPCFTAETLIATGQGLMPVGSLTPGQRIITRDNGLQELRWVGRRSFGWKELGLNPLLRPVRIAAGALGHGVPERDLVVSPNHRFLTRLPGEGETGERLTMARDLVGLDGIGVDPVSQVCYWQLLFDRHQLVLSEGCWSESFLPTQLSLAALGSDGRISLSAAIPGIEAEVISGVDSVRPFAEVETAA